MDSDPAPRGPLPASRQRRGGVVDYWGVSCCLERSDRTSLVVRASGVSILGCSRARWLLSAKRPSACTKRAPRALKPRLIIPHTPNNAAPRNKTARAAAPRAHRHDLRHDGISAVLNSARAAVEPRASLRTARAPWLGPPAHSRRPPLHSYLIKSNDRWAQTMCA